MSLELLLKTYVVGVGRMIVEHGGPRPDGGLRQTSPSNISFGVGDWGFSVEVSVRGARQPVNARPTAISGSGPSVALAVEDLRSKLDSWAVVLNPPRHRKKS